MVFISEGTLSNDFRQLCDAFSIRVASLAELKQMLKSENAGSSGSTPTDLAFTNGESLSELIDLLNSNQIEWFEINKDIVFKPNGVTHRHVTDPSVVLLTNKGRAWREDPYLWAMMRALDIRGNFKISNYEPQPKVTTNFWRLTAEGRKIHMVLLCSPELIAEAKARAEKDGARVLVLDA